jgi:hypothetical protein
MARNSMISPGKTLSGVLSQVLDQVASVQPTDRKPEIVNLLSNEQPAKSRMVDQSYLQCTWWEGCYYCQDETRQWHQVKCFI